MIVLHIGAPPSLYYLRQCITTLGPPHTLFHHSLGNMQATLSITSSPFFLKASTSPSISYVFSSNGVNHFLRSLSRHNPKEIILALHWIYYEDPLHNPKEIASMVDMRVSPKFWVMIQNFYQAQIFKGPE